MNRNIFSIGLLFCILASPTFAGTVTGSYSWEDGGTHLGQYGNVGSAENLYWDGSRGNVLALTEEPVKSTPQSYVAWITGLKDGDKKTTSGKELEAKNERLDTKN